jgi:hypothetical protein
MKKSKTRIRLQVALGEDSPGASGDGSGAKDGSMEWDVTNAKVCVGQLLKLFPTALCCTTAITEHHEHLCCSLDALKQTESTPGVMISMRSFLTSQSKDTACLAQKRCSWISLRYMLGIFTCGDEFPDFTRAKT